MYELRLGIFFCLTLSLALAGCTGQSAAKQPSPDAILQAISAASPAQYEHIRDTKNWRNPYLIIRPDGVAFFDVADSAEIILKPEEVLGALAKLPAANWPNGRVVAIAEAAHSSEQDGVAIRRNRGIVGGMLEDAHVAIKWIPAS